MPYAKETLKVRSNGTTKDSTMREIANLFGFTGLHDLGPALERVWASEGQRGRRSPFPATVMPRCWPRQGHRSISSAVALVSETEVCSGACSPTSDATPTAGCPRAPRTATRSPTSSDCCRGPPPTGTDPTAFRARRGRPSPRTREPEARRGAQPRPARPPPVHLRRRNILKPFSDVTLWVHPRTGEVLAREAGPRAWQPPRSRRPSARTRSTARPPGA